MMPPATNEDEPEFRDAPPAGSVDAPWEAMESGALEWGQCTDRQQEEIVRHYAPKIRYLALRLKSRLPRSVELGELLSSGALGLMEALGKFRAQMGIRFETYAESRIRGAMLDELRRLDWFPRSLRQRVRVLDEAARKLEHESGRAPTEDELGAATGLGPDEVRQGLEAMQGQLWLSLDAIQDTMAGDGDAAGDLPHLEAEKKELAERIVPLLDSLTAREKLVLSLYYTEELNMREAAEVMGVTEGRVSQLHSQALSRLRREFARHYGQGAS